MLRLVPLAEIHLHPNEQFAIFSFLFSDFLISFIFLFCAENAIRFPGKSFEQKMKKIFNRCDKEIEKQNNKERKNTLCFYKLQQNHQTVFVESFFSSLFAVSSNKF